MYRIGDRALFSCARVMARSTSSGAWLSRAKANRSPTSWLTIPNAASYRR